MRLYDEEPGIDSMALLMFLRKVMDDRSLSGPSLLRLVLYVQYERDFFANPHKRIPKIEPSESFPLFTIISTSAHLHVHCQ